LQRSHRQRAAVALSKEAVRSFAAQQKPTVANPSYAAYTCVSVGVEVPDLGNASFEIGANFMKTVRYVRQ
jgi:hypothetical protein